MLTSTVMSIVLGLAIRHTGRYKWLAIIGMPGLLLLTGLLSKVRNNVIDLKDVWLPQILLSVLGGMVMTAMDTAIMAAVSHEQLAAAIAMEATFGSIGAAIGQTVGLYL